MLCARDSNKRDASMTDSTPAPAHVTAQTFIEALV